MYFYTVIEERTVFALNETVFDCPECMNWLLIMNSFSV